ncbi:hypothetical protein [Mangrovimonas cancribranchiae]|uniref:DUF2007 domain-containing protein n=1 Tax=Mangrovimonas cancribranchiae TaxID=3080055 RepID=A0AAU6P5L9_9FLAO
MAPFLTVSTYMFPHELAIDRSKLESFGIECFVKDEFTIQTHNFLSNALGGIKLQVKQHDYDAALKILNDKPDLQTEYSYSSITCPNCGSGNIKGVGFNGKIALVLWIIIGIPIPIFSSKFYCFSCHQKHTIKR